MPTPALRHRRHRAFTLVELLVVVAIIALLIGIVVPALSGARAAGRTAASSSNLRQIGVGIRLYLNDFEETLPQVRVDDAGNPVRGSEGDNIGALFGGKLGSLGFLGIDRIGPKGRPLNRYVWDSDPPDDDADGAKSFEVPIFSDPSDAGTGDLGLIAMGADTTNTYNLLGTSYTINDHALDDNPYDEPYWTLVPTEGGRMPKVVNPTRTWVVGTQPIYNYDDGGDRGMAWNGDRITANLLFVDLHVNARLRVTQGLRQSGDGYTFLPKPGWLGRFGVPESQE
jgi:prepilin-type N-terminal cleavage/methylation domain-containing protein